MRRIALSLILPLLLAGTAGTQDPDSLAAAALMSSGTQPAQAPDLMRRAVAAAPDRADLVWLNLEFCLKGDRCDPAPVERRLRELDPANGAGWLETLARADAQGDRSARDAALAALSRSDRVDTYWTTLIARLAGAMARDGAISPGDAEVRAIGMLAALPIPPLGPVSASCRGEALARPGALEQCRGIARAFGAGDSYLMEMFGAGMAQRVWPEQSPEWQAAAEARRVYDYRIKLSNKVFDARSARAARDYLALCAHYHREQDVVRAQLVAAGENPDPPRAPAKQTEGE